MVYSAPSVAVCALFSSTREGPRSPRLRRGAKSTELQKPGAWPTGHRSLISVSEPSGLMCLTLKRATVAVCTYSAVDTRAAGKDGQRDFSEHATAERTLGRRVLALASAGGQ